jgi:hypothetical protein
MNHGMFVREEEAKCGSRELEKLILDLSAAGSSSHLW